MDITSHIIELERSALEKWNSGDPSGYLDIYADDINYFDPFQERRIDGLEKMKVFYGGLKWEATVDRYDMIHPVVQHAGTMAVLTYNLLSYAGGKVWKWNCTEVYRLEPEGQWKIIHNHWSFIKPMEG